MPSKRNALDRASGRAIADLIRRHQRDFEILSDVELMGNDPASKNRVNRARWRAIVRLTKAHHEEYARLVHAHQHALGYAHAHGADEHVHLDMPVITVGRSA